MTDQFPSMSVARAADSVRAMLVSCAHQGRVLSSAVLAARAGIGLRVETVLHARVELDIFGEQTRCLFRDRLMDLQQSNLLRDRDGWSVRGGYRLIHLATGVPVHLRVARTDEEWEQLTG